MGLRPEDLQNAKTKGEYFWGYAQMTTVDGLFAAGDASGASSHKFSSGSHAEGRIAAKAALAYVVDHNAAPKVDQAQVDALTKEMLKPLETFEKHKGVTTAVDVNPNYIRAKQFMYRLQKIMDEYAGGVSSQFKTSDKLIERGLELLGLLKEDAANLAADGLHDLMRCWEAQHRMYQADATCVPSSSGRRRDGPATTSGPTSRASTTPTGSLSATASTTGIRASGR